MQRTPARPRLIPGLARPTLVRLATFIRLVGLVGLTIATTPQPAHAQNGADKAAADTLFSEGKKLIADGDTETACTKFEASLGKVRQLGAQIALASCYEKLGKTASAWGEFRAAASLAAKARDGQRKRFAEEHAAELEAKLSRLVIKVEPGYRIDGLQVKRNGVELEAAELGTPVPVDPGDYTIEALAPGWVAWSTKVTVSMPGVVDVVVPALGKAPIKVEEPAPPAVSAPLPAATDDRRHARRKLAYIVGGSGVAVVAVSLIFGGVASSKWSEAQDHCIDLECDQTGVDLADSASTMGTISTATFLTGTAAVAAGAYLWFTSRGSERATEGAPVADPTALRLVPTVGPSQTGLLLQGGF
jgi:hypothetical protein